MHYLDIIEKKISRGLLPGEEAQIRMAHAFRRKLWPAPSTAVHAGVLILFYPLNGIWHLIFIERTSKHPNDVHGGQISFPGGRKDPVDRDMIDCAIREANEEVGLDSSIIKIIGKLTPLYIPVSNHLVHPVMAISYETPKFIADPSEVNQIIELPFEHFIEPAHIKNMDMMFGSGMQLNDVPYFDAAGKVIWGATAMMLSEVLALLE